MNVPTEHMVVMQMQLVQTMLGHILVPATMATLGMEQPPAQVPALSMLVKENLN